MLQSFISLLIFVFVLHVSAIYILPTLPDRLREERISSFMAQKPLPTSALLAGAAMASFPSPLPVGSHPLGASPEERVEVLQDEVDILMDEMEEVKEEIKRLKAKAVGAAVTNHEGKEKSSNEEKPEADRDWIYDESR